MIEIQLTQQKVSLIDDADFDLVRGYRWHFNENGYARTSSPKIYMHRLLTKAPRNKKVDHINGNRLDNRQCNLRLCDSGENAFNQKIRSDGSSGYKGVSWEKRRKHWIAYISYHKKRIQLGSFHNVNEAAIAYNNAATNYFGEFARLNEIRNAS